MFSNMFGKKNFKEQFHEVEKILDKEVNIKNKNFEFILKKNKYKKKIDKLINLTNGEQSYSCYDDSLVAKIKEKTDIENIEITINQEQHLDKVERIIERNINSLIIRLSNGIIISDKDNLENNNKNKFFDIKELKNLLSENINDNILKGILKLIVKNIKNINIDIIKELFNKTINHKNISKDTMNWFITITTIEGEGYLLSNGDEIDLNTLKTFVIKSGRISQQTLYSVIDIPYLGLWESILKSPQLDTKIINLMLDKTKEVEDNKVYLLFIKELLLDNETLEKILSPENATIIYNFFNFRQRKNNQ